MPTFRKMGRLSECKLSRPPTANPPSYGWRFNAKHLRKLRQASGDTTHGKNVIVAFISTLLSTRCPSAISRFVISIIVNALKGATFGPLSHVVGKVNKRTPSFTNSYAPTSVILKFYNIRICAASNHSCPNPVQFGSCESFPDAIKFCLGHDIGYFSVAFKWRACGYNHRSLRKSWQNYPARQQFA